jgi:hypothetical protein
MREKLNERNLRIVQLRKNERILYFKKENELFFRRRNINIFLTLPSVQDSLREGKVVINEILPNMKYFYEKFIARVNLYFFNTQINVVGA